MFIYVHIYICISIQIRKDTYIYLFFMILKLFIPSFSNSQSYACRTPCTTVRRGGPAKPIQLNRGYAKLFDLIEVMLTTWRQFRRHLLPLLLLLLFILDIISMQLCAGSSNLPNLSSLFLDQRLRQMLKQKGSMVIHFSKELFSTQNLTHGRGHSGTSS